jgi:P27 family predicted phage terminase small subunit
MKRGPKPTSKRIKKLRGSWRANLPNKGQIKVERPKRRPRPPKWLDGEGLAEWKRVAPTLYKLGLLTNVDVTMLALYCEAYATYLEHIEFLKRLKSEPSIKEQVIAKWSRLIRNSWADVCRLAEQFCMSPGNDSRILVRPPEETPSENWLKKHSNG